MPPQKKPSQPGQMLVNDLTVADARHLLRTEGGEIGPQQIAVELVTTAAVAATCAYAIVVGQATAWHLVLPMVAQYLTLLVLLPILYVILWLDGMRKDAVGAVRLWIILVVVISIAVAVRAQREDRAWMDQFAIDFNWLLTWITSHKMQWPMLCAAVGVVFDLPGRISNLIKYGPPFSAVGLGCGMRIAILFLGLFLLPFVVSSPTRLVWSLWAALILAEVLTVVMHLDIQRRLKKHDGEQKTNLSQRRKVRDH